MNAKQALSEAAMAGRLNAFVVSTHLNIERAYRNVSRRDLASALRTATKATRERETRWLLLGGVDSSGDLLHVVVEIDHGVTVVTAFDGK